MQFKFDIQYKQTNLEEDYDAGNDAHEFAVIPEVVINCQVARLKYRKVCLHTTSYTLYVTLSKTSKQGANSVVHCAVYMWYRMVHVIVRSEWTAMPCESPRATHGTFKWSWIMPCLYNIYIAQDGMMTWVNISRQLITYIVKVGVLCVRWHSTVVIQWLAVVRVTALEFTAGRRDNLCHVIQVDILVGSVPLQRHSKLRVGQRTATVELGKQNIKGFYIVVILCRTFKIRKNALSL